MVKRLSSTDQNTVPLKNVPTPVDGGDAANKDYVDDQVTNTAVPYTGATANVDLGNNSISTISQMYADNFYGVNTADGVASETYFSADPNTPGADARLVATPGGTDIDDNPVNGGDVYLTPGHANGNLPGRVIITDNTGMRVEFDTSAVASTRVLTFPDADIDLTEVPNIASKANDANVMHKNEIVYNVKDYGALGDGSNDDAAGIQSAINTAGTSVGGIVFIPIGTYIIETDLIVATDNVVIKGAGTGTLLRAKAGEGPNVIKVDGANNVEISHIKIDGNRANVSPQGTPQYSIESGIYVTDSQNVSIHNCDIRDCFSSGILVDSSDNILITDNHLSGSLDNQIFLRPTDVVGGVAGTGVTNATISSNTCHDSDFSAIVAIKSDYISVVNNVVYDTGITDGQGAGIGFEGCRWSNMVGNVVHGGGVQGLNVRHTLEGTVGAAELVSTDITLSGNVVTGTLSTNGDAGGISITDTERIMVTGNVITNCAKGINVTTAATTGCADVYLNANLIQASTQNGIVLDNTQANSPVILTNNYVKNTTGHGLFSTVLTYVMDGNVFTDSTGAGNCGIRFDTGASGIVQGCVFVDNADNGILLDGTSGNFDIRNNVSYNTGSGTQGRFFYESGSAGPSRLISNRSKDMTNEDYHLSHANSRAYLNDFATTPSDADMTDMAKLATIAGLADPNADRILFWDDSAGEYKYLTPGTNLTITGTTINATGGSSGVTEELALAYAVAL